MLRQDINLCHALTPTKPAAYFLSWRRFLYGQLLFFIFSLICFAYLAWHTYALEKTRTLLASQVEAEQKTLLHYKSEISPLFFEDDVGQTVDSMQQQLSEEMRLLQSLAMPMPFSSILLTLSATIIPDVWLLKITLAKSGDEIILRGKSMNHQALQSYISALTQNKLFTDFSFNVDDINNISANNNDQSLAFQITLKKKSHAANH